MGLVHGTTLKCGHYEYESDSFKNKEEWFDTLHKLLILNSEEDFRKYSLSELKKGHEEAKIMQLKLKKRFDELVSEDGHFEEAQDINNKIRFVKSLIEDSTILIGELNKILNYLGRYVRSMYQSYQYTNSKIFFYQYTNKNIFLDVFEIQMKEGENLMKSMEQGRVCKDCFRKMAEGKLKCPGWHVLSKGRCHNDAVDCGILKNVGLFSIREKTGNFLRDLKGLKERMEKIGIETQI